MTTSEAIEQALPGLDPALRVGRAWTLTIRAPRKPAGKPKVRTGKDGRQELVVPKPAAWWATLNDTIRNEHARQRRTNAWRVATREAAVAAGIATYGGTAKVRLDRARIDVQFRFARRAIGGTRRDPKTNWALTWKPIIDTLTDDTRRIPKVPSLGVIHDDAPRFLCCEECPHISTGEPIEPGPLAPLGLVVLTITELLEAVTS